MKRTSKSTLTWHALTLALCLQAHPASAWTSWIGVLEDWPTKDLQKSDQPVSYEARVRPLFVKMDRGFWQAAPKPGDKDPAATLPKSFSWDVCFSGRGEGSLTASMNDVPPPSPPYALRAEDRAPWRTRRSLDYAGWISEPVYKPIILSSSLNSSCKDPEKWRMGTGDKARQHLARMIELTKDEMTKQDPTRKLNEATAKVPKAWGTAKHGRFAVLKAKTNTKDISATFYIGDKGPQFIGFDAMMIDAGDFDSDGLTEVVFKQRSEKKDIYSLYAKGVKVTENVWIYP